MCLRGPCVCLIPMETSRGYQDSGTGVIDSYELQCGCWKLNPGPLKEQALVLNNESPLVVHLSSCYLLTPFLNFKKILKQSLGWPG